AALPPGAAAWRVALYHRRRNWPVPPVHADAAVCPYRRSAGLDLARRHGGDLPPAQHFPALTASVQKRRETSAFSRLQGFFLPFSAKKRWFSPCRAPPLVLH